MTPSSRARDDAYPEMRRRRERALELSTDIRRCRAGRRRRYADRMGTRALARTDAFRNGWLAQPTVQPKTAFSRFRRVRRADFEVQQRVDGGGPQWWCDECLRRAVSSPRAVASGRTECLPRPPFRCERGTGFTAHNRHSPGCRKSFRRPRPNGQRNPRTLTASPHAVRDQTFRAEIAHPADPGRAWLG